MGMSFWAFLALASVATVLLCVEDPSSPSKRSQKRKDVAFLLIFFAVIGFLLSAIMIGLKSEAAKGRPLTELATGVTYTAEWFSADGPTTVMKLKADNKPALYYEIPQDKIIFWGGEDKKVPPKFKVLTDNDGKAYAFKEVD